MIPWAQAVTLGSLQLKFSILYAPALCRRSIREDEHPTTEFPADQRDIHRQIFESNETVDYAFKGTDPEDADNRWLREAFENQVPIIYFLGIAPGRYQAMVPTFVAGWDAATLKAQIAFGVPEQDDLAPPENALERRYALRAIKQRLHQASFRQAVIAA